MSARDQFHRDKAQRLTAVLRRRLVHAVHRGDVWVVQRGRQLDRHAAIQRRVHRLPDGTHPPLTDLLDDAVVQQHLAGFK